LRPQSIQTLVRKMYYDPSTLSNINEVQTNHIELNLRVDFEHKILDGSVTLSIITITDNINKVILDTKSLNIKSVSQDGRQLKVRRISVA
jgi:aminopeptidase N